MARDYSNFDRDLSFCNGIECGIGLVKKLFELTVDERMTLFDESLVANIIDRYNFAEIMEALRGHK